MYCAAPITTIADAGRASSRRPVTTTPTSTTAHPRTRSNAARSRTRRPRRSPRALIAEKVARPPSIGNVRRSDRAGGALFREAEQRQPEDVEGDACLALQIGRAHV